MSDKIVDRMGMLLSAIIILMLAVMAVMLLNDLAGTEEPFGPFYEAEHTYCAVPSVNWFNKVPIQNCFEYRTERELRQRTRVHGLFWDNESYKVIH